MLKSGFALASCLVLFVTACSNSAVTQNPARENVAQTPVASAAAEAAGSQPVRTDLVDACALVQKSEIASVQGAPVHSTIPSSRVSGELAMSQCYYMVTSADGSKNLSVHLEVTQPDPKSSSPNAVRNYWVRTFGLKPDKGEDKEKKEGGKPTPVLGIGEESFWMGSEKAGAVYTLHKDKFVRISVGGPFDAQTKIEKSKALTATVLKRLS